MIACYRCSKIIKGKITRHVPPNYLIQIGVDFVKAFHPKCYKEEEAAAAKEVTR